jgi:hypothetical protein
MRSKIIKKTIIHNQRLEGGNYLSKAKAIGPFS